MVLNHAGLILKKCDPHYGSDEVDAWFARFCNVFILLCAEFILLWALLCQLYKDKNFIKKQFEKLQLQYKYRCLLQYCVYIIMC